jgi:hypothetical protein
MARSAAGRVVLVVLLALLQAPGWHGGAHAAAQAIGPSTLPQLPRTQTCATSPDDAACRPAALPGVGAGAMRSVLPAAVLLLAMAMLHAIFF